MKENRTSRKLSASLWLEKNNMERAAAHIHVLRSTLIKMTRVALKKTLLDTTRLLSL